jgi:hypothetical protein
MKVIAHSVCCGGLQKASRTRLWWTRRVQRRNVRSMCAITFFMLAVEISWEDVKSVIGHEEPLTPPVGLILAVLG